MSRNSLNNFDKRNVFDLSFPLKTTADMGQLIPIFCKFAYPGDVFKMNTDIVLRAAPMLAPIMHKVDVYTHFFKVPLRLLWDNWEFFITGGKDNNDASVKPTISFPDGADFGGLADNLDFPPDVKNSVFDALPFRAYAKVYNDWYYPENYGNPAAMVTTDGADTVTNTAILYRAWKKDMFTNALPSPQRGDPVFLPLGQDAPVSLYGSGGALTLASASNNYKGQVRASSVIGGVNQNALSIQGETGTVPDGTFFGYDSGISGTADLTSATAITVDALRTAIQTQQWAYLAARAGYRYTEWLRAFFGVKSSDARLQRSEYLGGGVSPIMVSEVLQTSSTDSTSPQGNMAGHGITANRSHTWKTFCEEHCVILGLLSIMPKAGYFQGVPREFTYKTRYDFPNPIFSHLGEQGVKKGEIYYTGTAADDEIFGYTPRFEEVRSYRGQCHGAFRSSLDFWHLDRKFESADDVQLNLHFVECHPSKRIFAVPSEPGFLCYLYHNIRAIRPFPKYGNPGLMDHY